MTTDPAEGPGLRPLPVPDRPEPDSPRAEGASEGVNPPTKIADPNSKDPQSGKLIIVKLCILIAACTVFLALGLAFRPTASGPSEIPNTPRFALAFINPVPTLAPGSLSVYSYLRQLPDSASGANAASPERARLTLEVYGNFGPHLQQILWSLDVTGFNGYSCRAPQLAGERVSEPSHATTAEYLITGKSRSVAPIYAAIQPFIRVRFCWRQGWPIVSRGSYLTAALPQVTFAEESGSLTRTLQLPGEILSQYTQQGGTPPTATTGKSWVWTNTLSINLNNQSSAPIPVVAASIAGLQRDNNHAFLSGIFFGIGGGALVTLITEFFGYFEQRSGRDRPGQTPTTGRPQHGGA